MRMRPPTLMRARRVEPRAPNLPRLAASPLLAVPLVLLYSSAAYAQADSGPVVRGAITAAALEGTTSVSVGGAVGYRLNPVMSLELEVTAVPAYEPDLPLIPLQLPTRLVFRSFDPDGQATLFTTNARLELPAFGRRVTPFVVGGGGVASISSSYTLAPSLPPWVLAGSPEAQALQAIFGPDSLSLQIPPSRVSETRTAMLLTLGGGASVRLTDRLSIDIDVRYARMLDDRDLNMGRFGGGVSYRF
jgi:hypothetical protein